MDRSHGQRVSQARSKLAHCRSLRRECLARGPVSRGNGSHRGAQPYRWRTHRIRGIVLPINPCL